MIMASDHLARFAAQLNRIEASTNQIERAVFGESMAGHTGLVDDVKALKQFREDQNSKVIWMSGAVAGAVAALGLGFKALMAKIFGT